jgi:hypothetical protein
MTNQQSTNPAPAPGLEPAPRVAFDPAQVDRLDWAILGAGAVALVFSFFDYYTFSASFGGYTASASASAWHGFFGWLAALAALGGAAVLGAQLRGGILPAQWPARLITLGAFALATLSVLIAFLVHPGAGYGDSGIHFGHGLGYWVSLLAIVAGLAVSYLRFTAEGGVLPWKAAKS